MKPREKVISDIASAIVKATDKFPEVPWGFPCIDGRDLIRLSGWMPRSEWPRIGIAPLEGSFEPREPEPWSRESIVEQLRHDVAFGFEKALNKRGISSELMATVVRMWLWILDDTRFEQVDYPQYGLPLFKAVAVAYGFDNPIGDARGDELRFSLDG